MINKSFKIRPACLIGLLFVTNLRPIEARLKGKRKNNIFTRQNDDDDDINKDGEYIIAFKETKPTNNAGIISAMTVNDIDTRTTHLENKYFIKRKTIYSDALFGFTAQNLTTSDVSSLRAQNDILFVEPNVKIFADPFEGGIETHSTSSGRMCDEEVIPDSIQAVGWKNVERRRAFRDVRVFVVDTGVADIPKELNIDYSLARNFVGEDTHDWDDCNGHGTHVAGTIAARKNGCGVVGVAAGITIVPIRVLDCNGDGNVDEIVSAINYISRVGIPGDVVNISLGGTMKQTAMDVAVENAASKGIAFAIAAGNDATHAKHVSPARARGPGIYTVCALGKGSSDLANFSNYGRPPVDVCAPGMGVVSLSSLGARPYQRSGTSMAAPHVAGLLARGKLKNSRYIYSQQDQRIYPTVDKI